MANSASLSSVEIMGPVEGRAAEVLTPRGAGLPRRPAPRVSTRAAATCWPRARRGRRDSTPARTRTSCPRPPPCATATGAWRRSRPDLQDRRVEITGPVDRKMIINALNSGAKVFMADFEDANSPDLGQPDRGPGQPDAIGGPAKLDFTRSATGRAYALKRQAAPC